MDPVRSRPPAESERTEQLLHRWSAEERRRLARLSAFLYATDSELRLTAAEGVAFRSLLPGARLEALPLKELFGTLDEHHPVLAAHRRALRGEPARCHVEWLGRTFEVRVEPSPGGDGHPVGTRALAVDVTESRREWEELKASEERMRSILEAAPDPVFLKDGQGRWMEANGAALRLFHLDGVDYRGKTDAELSTYTRFYREALLTCVLTDNETWKEGRLYHCEEAVPLPDGGIRYFDVYKVPLFHPDGRRKSFAVMGRDVTDRKLAEQERARRLAESQEAVRLRDEFLSIAAHELRTPLTALHLGTQRLRRLARDEAQAPLREVADFIDRQHQRLARLVGTLMDMSELQVGQVRLELGAVDLRDVVRDVTLELRDELDRARCPLTVSASGPVVGRWDRSRLEQVVSNLVCNALKYGAGQPVEVRVSSDGRQALLEVEDHGIGIPPERQPHVFGRFERAVSAQHYGGLGLGLYIVRQLVEAQGGSVALESEPGQGTILRVRLPLAGPSPAPPG